LFIIINFCSLRTQKDSLYFILQRENQNILQVGSDSDIKYAFLSLVLHVFSTGLGALFLGDLKKKNSKSPDFRALTSASV